MRDDERRNTGRGSSDKQEISRRAGPVYLPSASHQKKVETFRLNITEEDISPKGEDENPGNGPENPEAWKAHKKRSRKKGRKNRWFYRGIWIAMVVLVSAGAVQYVLSGLSDMLAIGHEETVVTIHLEKDATTEEIASILEENGVIENPSFFTLYSSLTKADGHYEYGSFVLQMDMDYEAIINTLQSSNGSVDTVTVTFPEGMSVQELAQAMEQNGVCSEEEVLAAANNLEMFQGYELIGEIDNAEERYYLLEGYLFPDTYEFYRGSDVEAALGRMITNCQNKLTDTVRERAEELNMTLDEVLTLASMIQKEAADTQDMYYVSSVFHNRLEQGPASSTARLDSDPTVWYPYPDRASVPEDQLESFQSRYNTYEIVGLPPGPICNPGADAIDAALNPQQTNYLYFCHDAEGNAYYASTLAQHQQNLQTAGLA